MLSVLTFISSLPSFRRLSVRNFQSVNILILTGGSMGRKRKFIRPPPLSANHSPRGGLNVVILRGIFLAPIPLQLSPRVRLVQQYLTGVDPCPPSTPPLPSLVALQLSPQKITHIVLFLPHNSMCSQLPLMLHPLPLGVCLRLLMLFQREILLPPPIANTLSPSPSPHSRKAGRPVPPRRDKKLKRLSMVPDMPVEPHVPRDHQVRYIAPVHHCQPVCWCLSSSPLSRQWWLWLNLTVCQTVRMS